jgi:hypothetical protein
MRESSIFPCASRLLRRKLALFLAAAPLCLGTLLAADKHDAERAARRALPPLEKLGFVFRADAWTKDINPDVGKAVRMQLFKGLDYRFVVAVPPTEDAVIEAAVLDFEGKVASQQVGSQGEAKTVIISIKPRKTGVYVVVVRQGAGHTKVPCCILTGYK